MGVTLACRAWLRPPPVRAGILYCLYSHRLPHWAQQSNWGSPFPSNPNPNARHRATQAVALLNHCHMQRGSIFQVEPPMRSVRARQDRAWARQPRR